MDESSPSGMPADVREHIQHCTDCHDFVRQWNAIEVGLLSMRGQTLSPAPSFEAELDGRLATVPRAPALLAWFQRLIPPRQVRLLAAGACAVVLGTLLYLFGGTLTAAVWPNSGATIASSSRDQPTEPPTPIPAQIQLGGH